jgi:hypothetical protein
MPRVVARRAERNAVGRLIAQRRVLGPRLQMVRVQLAASLRPAILAGPIVALHDGCSERLVERVAVVSSACRSCSALPVRMRWADQVVIARRLNTSLPQPVADRDLVTVGERPAAQGLGDVIPLLGGHNSPSSRRLSLSRSGNPRPRSRRFGGIVGKVSRHRPARARAELQAPPNVGLAALIAGSPVGLRHGFNHSGKVA